MNTATVRKLALVAGVLYLITFVTSIPALGLYDKVLNNPGYVLGVGPDGGVAVGALLEVICALAGIGTAVALYPIAKRQSQTGALGFVTSRTVEAAMIMVGVVSILAAMTLRQDVAGAAGTDPQSLVVAGHSLVALHDWTFLLGPGVMPAVNAFCIATIMYRAGLLPRWIPTLGLIGAPILLASSTAILFGAWDSVSGPAMLFAIPIAVWEFSFGCYMTFKGFRPSPVTVDLTSTPATNGKRSVAPSMA